MAYKPENLLKIFDFGDPFADDPANAEPYYATIGRIAVIWGRFEQGLEHTLYVISLHMGIREVPPISYTRKLKRLKLLCRDSEALAPLLDTTRTFVTTALGQGKKRHALTHANWQGFDPIAPEPTVIFFNIDWDAGRYAPEKRSVPLSELTQLASDIHKLNTDLLNEIFLPAIRCLQRVRGNSEPPA